MSEAWWVGLLRSLFSGIVNAQTIARAGGMKPAFAGDELIMVPSGYDADDDEMRKRVKIVSFMRQHIGGKYLLGIEVPSGHDSDVWDCSELVEACFHAAGLSCPDGSPYQYDLCRPVPSGKMGDLHFLWNAKWGRIGHVMVDSGEGTVIHARSGAGVCEEPLEKYTARDSYRGCRRHPDFSRPPADR